MEIAEDDDYQYSLGEDVEVDEEPSETVGEAVGGGTDELPLIEGPAEQTAAGLSVNVEESVEPAPAEKSKKKTSKRKRKSTGRHIGYKDAGFVDDKKACAKVLYAVKYPEASADVPPLSELEEGETYARFARSQMRSQAFLNKMVADYQRKSKKLKADFERQCITNARLADDLQKKTDENKSLQIELAEAKNLADKQSVELKALGEYSKVVKTRADRLRERLVYLNKVKGVSKKADQARSTLKVLKSLVTSGVKIPKKAFEDMEKDASGFEAKLKEFEPVELEEEDLTPLGAYVPNSEEFEWLLRTEVSSEHNDDEPMRDADVEETHDVARLNEEEGGGGAGHQAE